MILLATLAVIGLIGVVFLVLALGASSLGLGSKEDFFFFRQFGWSRGRMAAAAAVLVAFAGVGGLAVWLKIQRLSAVGRRSASQASGFFVDVVPRIFHDRVRRIAKYYELGTCLPAEPRHRTDYVALFALSTLLQLIYFFAIPLTFECDAASYYNFARAIIGSGGAYSHVRGPGYPLFLIATGALWPQTFLLTLLIQGALGILAPIVFYLCLVGYGRVPALLGSLVLIASAIPFTTAKLVLTEQLYMFTVLTAIMYLALYNDRGDARSIHAFTFFALVAMFTRWEAQLMLAIGLTALFILAYPRPRHLRHVVLATTAAVVIIGGYSIARGLFIDRNLIGTLQNGTGAQMLFRMMSIGESTFPGPEHHVSPGPAGVLESARFGQLVQATNGPATARLKTIVTEHIRKYPEAFRSLKAPLSQLSESKDGPPDWIYDEAFGRFDGSAERLVDNIFSAAHNIATEPYIYYVTGIAQRELGVVEADKLLLRVGLEAVLTHPKVLLRLFIEFPFQVTGMTLYGAEQLVTNPLNAERWRNIFHYWNKLTYADMGYDSGGCASASLPLRMLNEYQFDQRLRHVAFADVAVAVASFLRNFIRPFVGILFCFGFWVILFGPRKIFNISVLAVVGAMIMTAAVMTGVIVNYRYEYAIFPLELMIATIVVTELVRRLRRRTRPKAAGAFNVPG